jgi:hypothetical protein
MRHWRWRAISCPPALARCPVSIPSARGFCVSASRNSEARQAGKGRLRAVLRVGLCDYGGDPKTKKLSRREKASGSDLDEFILPFLPRREGVDRRFWVLVPC